jgi:DUF4097 and DUF4098 domain-containing protein YvlB
MQRTFSTPTPVELYVELGSGELRTTTSDTDETTVEVRGPRADEFVVEQRDRQINVLAPRGKVGFFGTRDDHTVVVGLPTESDVTTKTGSADAELTGRYGVLHLKTGSGNVTVDEAVGPVLVESGSGDVELGTVGEIRVKSGSGDVEVGESSGRAGISTGSGDVIIGRSRAAAVVKTGSGDLQVTRTDDDVSLTTGSGNLLIGTARRGSVTAKSGSGDVAVGVPSGTPVWTDISTVSGRVDNQLPATGEPADGQDYVELRASSVSGDVVLREA